MGKRFPRFTRGLIGAVLAALGVFLLVFQQDATDIVARVSGAGFAVAGAISIIGCFTGGAKGAERFGSSFSGGIVLLALGLFLVAWPEAFISYLYILISVAIIFYGVEGISRAVASHAAGSTRWGAALLAAIVIVLLGVCTLATPLAEADTAMRVEAVILLIVGVLGLLDAVYLSGTGKKKEKKAEQAKGAEAAPQAESAASAPEAGDGAVENAGAATGAASQPGAAGASAAQGETASAGTATASQTPSQQPGAAEPVDASKQAGAAK